MAEQYLNHRYAVEPRLIVIINVHVFHPADIHRCRTRVTRNRLHVHLVHISRRSNVHAGRRKCQMSNARWSEKRCRVPLLAEGQFSSNVVLRDYSDDECARLLGCGFHRCQKLCHAGDCGACTAQCGKDRKLWYVSFGVCRSSAHICRVCQRIIHVHDLVMHLQGVPKMSPAKHW